MRANNAIWETIAQHLKLARNTVRERGAVLQAETIRTKPCRGFTRPNSDTLPAGHPLTWGIISDHPFPRWEFYTFTNC